MILLILAFVGTGTGMLITGINRQNELQIQTAKAKQALQALDDTPAAEQEAMLKTREESGEALQQQISDAQKELQGLDQELQDLDQEKHEILEAEESQYYLTIIESFMKGMELVDGYLNEAQ